MSSIFLSFQKLSLPVRCYVTRTFTVLEPGTAAVADNSNQDQIAQNVHRNFLSTLSATLLHVTVETALK